MKLTICTLGQPSNTISEDKSQQVQIILKLTYFCFVAESMQFPLHNVQMDESSILVRAKYVRFLWALQRNIVSTFFGTIFLSFFSFLSGSHIFLPEGVVLGFRAT